MEQEKTIVLGEVPADDAVSMLHNAPKVISGVAAGVPRFNRVDEFTTFLAEYAMVGSDLVMHFFGTEEHPNNGSKEADQYWKVHFPSCLDQVGQEHFQATAPRLVAKYTEEMKSWFLKAQGYDHLTSTESFVMLFCRKLDSMLEGVKG